MERKRSRIRLLEYRPYIRQREFHDAGGVHTPRPGCPAGCVGQPHRERMLMGGNQVGKTICGGAEAAMHLTGRYPEGWRGKRFDRPTRGWAGCDTFVNVRDGAQRILIGEPKIETAWGTGLIPGDDLAMWARAGGGVPALLDHVVVRHVSGGMSTLAFKSYDQGRRKWQGETLDFVWFDEEPPEEIYYEGLTRTNATGGIVWLTFTPLNGMSDLVAKYIEDCGGLK